MKTIKANDGKTYYLPQNPVWRTGFPDKPGWYPASRVEKMQTIRFFDGHCWSYYSNPWLNSDLAAAIAKNKESLGICCIEWSTPWWTPEAQAAIKKGDL